MLEYDIVYDLVDVRLSSFLSTLQQLQKFFKVNLKDTTMQLTIYCCKLVFAG